MKDFTYTSLGLSNKIHQATGWDDTFAIYEWSKGSPEYIHIAYPELERKYGLWTTQDVKERIPAYDTDYLLDKLAKTGKFVEFMTFSDDEWIASFAETAQSDDWAVKADTPTEALGLLVLKLKEKGEL